MLGMNFSCLARSAGFFDDTMLLPCVVFFDASSMLADSTASLHRRMLTDFHADVSSSFHDRPTQVKSSICFSCRFTCIDFELTENAKTAHVTNVVTALLI